MGGRAGLTIAAGNKGLVDGGTSSGSGGGAPVDAKYWVGAANATLTQEENLGALATGLVKNTAGVPSIAVAGTDYLAPSSIAITQYYLAYGTGTGITGNANLKTNANFDLLIGNPSAGVISPHVDVDGAGASATEYGLALRSGNASGDANKSTQIVMGLNGTLLYAHRIQTDSDNAVYTGNRIDFSVWNPALLTTVPGNVRSLRIDPFGIKVSSIVLTSGTSSPNLTVTAPAHTGLTASTEAIAVNFALNATQQFATGALTTQRAFLVQAPTYSFVGASTITNAASLAVSGAPIAGTNATITYSWAIWQQTGRSLFADTAGVINDPLVVRTQITAGSTLESFTRYEVTDPGGTHYICAYLGALETTSEGVFVTANAEYRSYSYHNFRSLNGAAYAEIRAGLGNFSGDGTNVFQLPADATGNATAAIGRIPVSIGGVTRYLRYYAD